MVFLQSFTVLLGLLTHADSCNTPSVRPIPIERNEIRSVPDAPAGCRRSGCGDRRIDVRQLVPIPDPAIPLKTAQRIA
ncbi:MAG: hypothetical protein ACE5KM_03370 [Planctomycetaceae bacterium]